MPGTREELLHALVDRGANVAGELLEDAEADGAAPGERVLQLLHSAECLQLAARHDAHAMARHLALFRAAMTAHIPTVAELLQREYLNTSIKI